MGFSIVIACGIVALSLTFLIISFYLTSIEIYESFLSHETELRLNIVKHAWRTAITVDSVRLLSEYEIEIKVTNQGSIGIPESDFKSIDIIVVYSPLEGQKQEVRYLNYNPSGGLNTWHVSSVLTNGVEGESLNVICPCPKTGKGIWDPGETLVIKGVLDQPANLTMPIHAYVNTPWGIGGYR